jgi:hypothetical protein
MENMEYNYENKESVNLTTRKRYGNMLVLLETDSILITLGPNCIYYLKKIFALL